MTQTYKQVNDAGHQKRETKKPRQDKPISAEDKRKCEIRWKREALEEDMRINKEYGL